MSKRPTHKLIGVPETMMIPLYGRAIETQRGGIIRDNRALEMMQKIDYDFSKFEQAEATIAGIAVRTEIFDELTRAHIAKHPQTTIVNIAAGLDTRFYRVDNGQLRWIDLDLPESIEMRKHFITPTDERHTMIAANALDFAWMDALNLSTDNGLLFIIEGLLMYFTEDQVKSLLVAIAERFDGAVALAEVIGRSQAQRKDRSDSVSKTSAWFQWGIRHAEDIGTWHEKIHYVQDISLYDRYEERWLALDVDWPAPPKDLRNTTHRIVELRFGR